MKIKPHARYQYAPSSDESIIPLSPAAAAIQRKRRKDPVREARRQAELTRMRASAPRHTFRIRVKKV